MSFFISRVGVKPQTATPCSEALLSAPSTPRIQNKCGGIGRKSTNLFQHQNIDAAFRLAQFDAESRQRKTQQHMICGVVAAHWNEVFLKCIAVRSTASAHGRDALPSLIIPRYPPQHHGNVGVSSSRLAPANHSRMASRAEWLHEIMRCASLRVSQ